MLIDLEQDAMRDSAAGKEALVPRFNDQGYSDQAIAARRCWVEERTGASLKHIGSFTVRGEQMRGNIENPIGMIQMPVGVAGPLLIRGQHARGSFYIPLATTEGALVRSYERGMVTLTRGGGVTTRIYADENRISPMFVLPDVASAHEFAAYVKDNYALIKNEADSTTRHGKLLRLECQPVGRDVIVSFCYFTADAHGMNMIVKATEHACRWIIAHSKATDFCLFSGYSSEKRGSGALFAGGKGKKVVAGAQISASLLRQYLHITPQQLVDLWRHTMIGHLQAHALGYNGHYANGLTALFIACGQDVANVVNSAVGITNFELTGNGGVYVSATLPALTVATVGGGTGLGTGRECLQMLGVVGPQGAPRLAEIAAAVVLAGEISMAAAIASGEFVRAHEEYGRNRPDFK